MPRHGHVHQQHPSEEAAEVADARAHRQGQCETLCCALGGRACVRRPKAPDGLFIRTIGMARVQLPTKPPLVSEMMSPPGYGVVLAMAVVVSFACFVKPRDGVWRSAGCRHRDRGGGRCGRADRGWRRHRWDCRSPHAMPRLAAGCWISSRSCRAWASSGPRPQSSRIRSWTLPSLDRKRA